MDRNNVVKLRDTLVALREHGNEGRFDMSDFFQCSRPGMIDHPMLYNANPHTCGTAACLLGWACMLRDSSTLAVMPQKQGREWLGLDDREGDWWGMGRWARWMPDDGYAEPISLSRITLPMAIDFLGKVLASGDTTCEVWFDDDE